MQQHLEARGRGFPKALRRCDQSCVRRVVHEIVDKACLREDRFGHGNPIREPLGADGRRIHEQVPGSASCELFYGDDFHSLVESIRQGLRPLGVPAGDLDLGALSQQHIDDGSRGAARPDHESLPISDPQTKGTQRKAETEHVRVVTLRPSIPEHHRVDGPETFRIAVELVEPFGDRLLVGNRHVQAPEPQSVRTLEKGIQGIPLDVERKIDAREVQRGERGLVDGRGKGMTERMTDEAQDDRRPTPKPFRGGKRKLTRHDTGAPRCVLELLAAIVREGPCHRSWDSSPNDDRAGLSRRAGPHEVHELNDGFDACDGHGDLRDIANGRTRLHGILHVGQVRRLRKVMGHDDPGAMLLRSLPEFLGPSPVRFELDIDIGETLGRDFPQQAASIARRRPQPSLIGRAQCGDRPRTDRDGETPDDAGIEPVQMIESQFRQVGSPRQGRPCVALRIARIAGQDDRRDLRHVIAPQSSLESACRSAVPLLPSGGGPRRPPSIRPRTWPPRPAPRTGSSPHSGRSS